MMNRRKRMKPRGFFGIAIYNPKNEINVGCLWRSAHNMDASILYTIGRRYRRQCSDTTNAKNNIPLLHCIDFEDFKRHLPECPIVGVEQTDTSIMIDNFSHPERCIYLLGAEDNGLPQKILNQCHSVIEINSKYCLNVAVAGSIVIFHRNLGRTND